MTRTTELVRHAAKVVLAAMMLVGGIGEIYGQTSSPALRLEVDNRGEADAPSVSSIDQLAIRAELNLSSERLLSKDLRAIGPSTDVVKLSSSNVDFMIRPNTLIFERTGTTSIPSKVADNQAWRLPVRFSYIRDDGSTFSFVPDIRVLRPLRYDLQDDAFEGLLGFGVIDESNPQSVARLDAQVSFALASALDTIDPRQFEVTHLGQPFEEVVLRDRSPDNEVPVEIITRAFESRDRIAVPTIRPHLQVSITPTGGIDGFGLSTADVHVSAVDGGAFRGRAISVATDVGRFLETGLTLDSSGTAHTTLRSSFVGTATVAAKGYPFADGSAQVYYRWPVASSIAAAIGALAGAWLGVLWARRQRQNRSFSVGLVSGLVGAVLAALGVNFLELPVTIPAGEAFILAVSCGAAFLGPEVLIKLFSRGFAGRVTGP